MTIQPFRTIKNLVLVIVFGAVFWMFLELLQTTVVNLRFGCCERCENILFAREHLILALCAMLSFLAAARLKTKGWKGILKTLAVSSLCFQIYFVLTK